MTTRHTNNLADTRYPSLLEFMDAAQLPPRNKANSELTTGCDTDRYAGRESWAGAPDTASAVDAMSKTYDDGNKIIAKVTEATSDIKLPPSMDTRRRRVRADQGDNLDIHAVYRGQLDRAWDRIGRRQVTAPPMVSICINAIIQGGSDKSIITYRGAVGVVLCRLLERFGYRVRLVVGFGGSSGRDNLSCRVTVKDYGRPLDQETVSCATHPALFRILGHRWGWAHQPGRGSQGGFSVQCCVSDGDAEIVIGHEVRDLRSAIARITGLVAQLSKGAA